ncbi:hypothetical protein ACFSUS_01820 [Spirosoma soli]|uniref:WG repeat-containing protein n=1 Tax=Spirosoma soli TaxID=1770529 RepID=A0ABW5LZ79_9BACT
MKTKLVLIGIGVIAHGTICAQTPQVIRVKGGTEGVKAIPLSERYRYDQFREGKVLYQNGTAAAAQLNYNVLLGEMQFISPNGDTLTLMDDPIVRLIGINGPTSQQDLFMYDPAKGYMEIVADNNGLRLGVKQGLKTVKNEKRGGYDQSSGASAITNYQYNATGNTSIAKLDTKGDLLLIKDKTYFIIDQNNRSYPVNKASVLKVFSKHREQVTAYLENEAIDFRQENDLKKLLKFCSELL